MSITPGTRLGPYEVVAPLGAGGMGEVYRATEDVYANKGDLHTGYDVAPDGRLLFARDGLQQASMKYLAVIENWLQELSRHVPVK